MAWTTPASAVTGDFITAAFWNTNGRDNLNYLFGILNGLIPQDILLGLNSALKLKNATGSISMAASGSAPEVLFIDHGVSVSGTLGVTGLATIGNINSGAIVAQGTSSFGGTNVPLDIYNIQASGSINSTFLTGTVPVPGTWAFFGLGYAQDTSGTSDVTTFSPSFGHTASATRPGGGWATVPLVGIVTGGLTSFTVAASGAQTTNVGAQVCGLRVGI